MEEQEKTLGGKLVVHKVRPVYLYSLADVVVLVDAPAAALQEPTNYTECAISQKGIHITRLLLYENGI